MSTGVLRPGVRATVWFLLGLSVVGTLAAILYGQQLAQPTPHSRDSYTVEPLGNRALLETLEALGVHVLRARRGDFAQVQAPLLFIEPEAEALVDGVYLPLDAALAARTDAGLASIVILPKWRWEGGKAFPDDGAQAIVDAVLPGAALVHAQALHVPPKRESATGTLGEYGVSLPWMQTLNAPDVETLLSHQGRALVVRRPDGVVVVSDPDLAHNWNLHREDHAAILFEVLRDAGAGDSVAFDEVFHGHAERRSLGAALGQFPAVLLSAHGLALVLLVVWIGSRRFGRPQDLPPPRHGPAESIAVSAFVLAEGRPLGPLAARYVHAQLADLSARLGLAPGRPPSEQAAHIDRVAAQRGEEPRAAALLARADAGPTKSDALRLAQDAHQLRARIL